MDSDDAVIEDFLQRLEGGQLDGRLNDELSKLSYAQLLTVTRVLTHRSAKDAKRE